MVVVLQGRRVWLAVIGLAAIVAPLATGCRNDGVTIGREGSPGTGGAAGAANTGVAGAGIGAAGAGGLAGAGTEGAGGSTADGGGGAAGGIDGSSVGGGAGIVTLRVANFFLPSGSTTGPSLDIYDDMYNFGIQPSASGTPLIAGLAYGTLSSYVKPRFVAGNGAGVELVALPAGRPSTDTTDAQQLWNGQDDGSQPQLTLAAYNQGGPTTLPLSGLNFYAYYEKGDEFDAPGIRGPIAPSPPTGQGEYLVSLDPVDVMVRPTGNFFFLVDDSCAPQINPSPSFPTVPGLPSISGAGEVPPLDFSEFAADPGAHSISVAFQSSSSTTPTCSELPGLRQGSATVSVAAGQQIITFVYGSSLTDLHLLTGAVAP